MTTKGFQFIDSTKRDRATQRLARSHAMKGKNAGRKFNRRSKLQNLENVRIQKVEARNIPAQRPDEDINDSLGVYVRVRPLWGHLSLNDSLNPFSFPVDLTPQSQSIINEFFMIVNDALYLPQICRSTERFKFYWLRTMLIDDVSYHCAIALMGSMNGFFFNRDPASPGAIKHVLQVVRLVNRQLQGSEALSNSSIAVVSFMVMQQLLRESRSEAEIHLNGLWKLIELRGGLSKVEDNALVVKICKTDLDYALHFGTSPSCHRDRMSEVAESLASEGYLLDRSFFDFGSSLNDMDPHLRQILFDVRGTTSLFNGGCKMDYQMVQEIVVSVGGRLVQFHPLAEPPLKSRLESACHIGLTAFVTTLLIRVGRRRFLKYALVTQCLREAIDRGLDEEDNDLMLWLLFMGGISVLEEIDHAWLALSINCAARSLGIGSWAEVHRSLVRFPWINALHDEAGKGLWNAVTQSDRDSKQSSV